MIVASNNQIGMHIVNEDKGEEDSENLAKSKKESKNLGDDPINAAVIGLLRLKKCTAPITLDLHNNKLDECVCVRLLEEVMNRKFLVRCINLKLNKMNMPGPDDELTRRWLECSLSVMNQVSPSAYANNSLII